MAAVAEAEITSSTILMPEKWAEAADTIAYDSNHLPTSSYVCLYKKLAYLDTDVGQAEFTPPGLLSLIVIDQITPDLTIPCLKTPERCYFFGDISSKRDPTTYLTYIMALYDHYRKQYGMTNSSKSPSNSRIPLVINTSGWVKDIGYDILVNMLKYISPDYVVKICISTETENLPAGGFWLDEDESTTTTIIEVNSASQDSLKRSVLIQKDARLLRGLCTMAYFRQCFPRDTNITTIKELARVLAAHPPFEISIASIEIKHLHCQVPKNEIFYRLNATVVGLAISSEVSENLPHWGCVAYCLPELKGTLCGARISVLVGYGNTPKHCITNTLTLAISATSTSLDCFKRIATLCGSPRNTYFPIGCMMLPRD